MKLLEGKYGYFADNGKEYVITDWRTPRPWINVISNGLWGLTLSQAGGGYSWLSHAMLNRITRWNQDMTCDNAGKFLFLRDNDSSMTWSLTPAPMKPSFDQFTTVHGMGYTRFIAEKMGITTELTVFVPRDLSCEIWKLKVTNQSRIKRNLSLFSYLELLMGVFPDWHREFHNTFIRTRYDKSLNAIIADKTLWAASFQGDSGWNKPWPYDLFFMSDIEPDSYECDRNRFIGQYNSIADASAFKADKLSNRTGTGFDPIIGYHFDLTLHSDEVKEFTFCLGADLTINHEQLVKETIHTNSRNVHNNPESISSIRKMSWNSDELLNEVKLFWSDLCDKVKVDTPDQAINIMVNYWLKYQTVSCRLLGRSAYYQCGGAFGFRDQLQDSLIYLTLDPSGTEKQILHHAEHQKSDGSVHHWWHPVSEEGLFTNMSDDLLWLPYAVFKYLNETDDYEILQLEVPFYDTKADSTILNHCEKAVELALSRRSPRGLSLIGEGDWNDGMNGVGVKWKGESIWLSQFLYGILIDFVKVSQKCSMMANSSIRKKFESKANEYQTLADELKNAILKSGRAKDWFARATTDRNEVMGSENCKQGKIFLNPQTWAIITGLVDKEEGRKLLSHVEKHLYKDYGVLLFTPAYTVPDREIGYLTRYAPGVRENGGVYTHAATWAIIAQALADDSAKAYETFKILCPAYLSNSDPDKYSGEPYVMPGNIEGPESLHEGRGAWTWYTGSAAWYYRAILDYVLGVRVEDGKIVVKPRIPDNWQGFTAERTFRGKKVKISVGPKVEGISESISEGRVITIEYQT
ncbi:MAG: glycosyl transferase family 36 [Candidatus Wallbacteria bacterium HGW-Wallbacteria-1]|jgi:cellobiose phosphorylase|uniref:Glycosyl transferase family 36 n=1 Tax=Candidatus Wallbacteria bacterium HGW-Wallbacteria-1 TaxID=2013854 RepID=A0A2N1PL10_9BACT|nr:MAG: glycosyl transferase family 36 [Candidatus Wallbacteria bacterium HGW-Wallbacteria-1]